MDPLDSIVYGDCKKLVSGLIGHVSDERKSILSIVCYIVDDWVVQNKYSEPMVWIGIYISIASLLCILAMAADLLHGFRNEKMWFPCKYFSLNAASIIVITVTMKLPVDLSTKMPSYMDQAAKLASLAFMCTMMANFMPSLASMSNKTLLANTLGLSILVVTMSVNIFIDIYTGVIKPIKFNLLIGVYSSSFNCVMVAYIYIVIIVLSLMVMISASLTIPTSKEILEVKYQTTNKTLNNQHLQSTQMSRIEKLRQHVGRYWVMAETGNPQFVMASIPLSTASGVICVIVYVLNLLVVLEVMFGHHGEDGILYNSAYKWSILSIFITQSIGVLVSTLAPMFRCFSILSFKFVTKWNKTHFMIFKVEKYWTQKLSEWKQSPVHFLSSGRLRTLIYNSKGIIISLCIILQKAIVILCKAISLIPKVIPIVIVCCWKSLKARVVTPTVTSGTDNIDNDVSCYVLKIHDEVELAETTLARISNSMNSFILKAEKEQNKDLLELLEKSTGFRGVEIFDTDQVQTLFSVELVNSWSLPIVTLTCIAVALPNIRNDAIKSLLRRVGEGLSYTHQVEESLNCESEYVNARKATVILWNEVEHKCKWLGKALQNDAFRGKTATEILKWFSDRGKEIVTEIKGSISEKMVNTPTELIAANSMYRIAETILVRDGSNTEQINEEQLFALLNGMVADILSACFTNIPRVITVKCNESVIEKREASVKAAAKLLGKTTKIIERLETCELPRMDPDKMAYVDEWRTYLKQSIPCQR